MTNMHYVGVLKEIIDVSHGRLHFVVMRCSWIPVNTRGNATVKQDEYGFWLMVNHGRKVHGYVEPYVFPSIVF